MSRRERALRNAEDRIYRLTVGGPPDTRWQRIVSAITEEGYLVATLKERLGLPVVLETEDRRILEQVIFPYYCDDPGIQKILFVGCARFTAHYQRDFFVHKEFWTIEPERSQAKFGSTRHVIAPLEDLAKHFDPEYFDLIFFNGVYGWGLDTRAQGEAAFAHCHSRLRDGGHLLFGWNDVPQRTPFPIDEIESRRAFKRFDFPPFGTWRHFTDTRHRHVFDFYCK